ncbi:MAG TPA: SGNH/GDSL hydrolase family protein [Pyrinomonadaceae bacterium]
MKKAWIKKLSLLLASLVFCALVILLLEAVTRILWPEINAQDTEQSLLRPKAFGDSYGWQPRATGTSFGKTVFIDEFGFRKLSVPEHYTESWIILGDSVTFGVGVETEETFVQLLQNTLPRTKLWNTAVIGYNIRNYRDALYHLTSDGQNVPNLRRVLLFLCLNDIDLNDRIEQARNKSALNYRYVLNALSFMRRHSKFYMLMKGALTDRSKFYFLNDYQLYQERGESLTRSMELLNEVNTFLRFRNIALTVVILPYEYQLRTKEARYLVPQKLLAAYFKEMGISYHDAYGYFERSEGDEKENFLYADFGHLSKKGHRIVFNLLRERLSTE